MALPYKQRASSDCFSAAITDQQRPWNTCTEGTEHKAMDTAAVVRVAQPNAVTAASSPLLSQSDSFPFPSSPTTDHHLTPISTVVIGNMRRNYCSSSLDQGVLHIKCCNGTTEEEGGRRKMSEMFNSVVLSDKCQSLK